MPSIKDKMSKATSKLENPREPQEDHPANFGTYEDGQYLVVETASVKPNPDQPRQHFDPDKLNELASSIKEKGLLQPLIIRVAENRDIYLIAGERRLRACKLAGLSAVPAIVKTGDSAELALIENIQREDLNPVDEAEALNKLVINHNYTQDKLAQVVGKAKSTISEIMSLNRLPDSIKEEVRRAELYPRRLLIEIAKQGTQEKMIALFATVKAGNMKSTQVREITRQPRADKQRTPAAVAIDKVSALQKHLTKLDMATAEDSEKIQLLAHLQILKQAIEQLLN